MTSPRHLWSGDWRRDSDAAADELARRRAQEGTATQPEPEPIAERKREADPHDEPTLPRPFHALADRTPKARQSLPPAQPSQPPREPTFERASAALRRGLDRLRTIPAPTRGQRRAALLIALGALVLAGAAYGLASLGGSGGPSLSLPATGRPWLGAELSQPPGGGVIVGAVAPGGPSNRAGVQPGDVIMAVGNRPVSSPGDVESAIEKLRVGDRVPITVLRGASSYTTLVRLAGAPAGTP
jgi:hypothetical protein